jgi:hypothetical protein
MKKRYLLFASLFLLIAVAYFVSAEENLSSQAHVTSYVITSYVTSQPVFIGIRIIGTPSLYIWEPENGTYVVNESVPLNYSMSDDVFTAWYTIDGSAPVSITANSSFIYFNTTDGVHNLTVYANNSMNLTVKSTIFIANSSKFTIIYRDEFKTNYSGDQLILIDILLRECRILAILFLKI